MVIINKLFLTKSIFNIHIKGQLTKTLIDLLMLKITLLVL